MEIGTTLAGRYELRSRIGHGGMGEVFRGFDRSLERDVAIKVLPAHLIGDAQATDRFRREARIAGSLTHPNIVTVHDVVTDRNAEAIVMELIDGPTLADVIRTEGAQPWRRVLAIGASIADGLAAAHRRGLIHRDVKPSNVMLAEGGRVKVTDFGIARALAASQTMTSTVQGSAPYLAPEQAKGDDTDQRTDVYSLGCVLYELLTGRPPFVAEDALGIVYQHLNDAPAPPSARNPDVPAHVDAVVLRALSKQPGERFDSVEQLGQVLRTAAQDPEATRRMVGAAAVAPTQLMRDRTRVLPPDATARRPAAAPPPRRGGPPPQRTTVTRAPPRQGRNPFIVMAIAAVVILLLLLLAGALSDAFTSPEVGEAPTTAPPATEATPTTTAEPTTEPTSPEPSPSPTPTQEPPDQVEESSQALRSEIAGARSDGMITAKTEDELDKLLTESLKKHNDGDTSGAIDEAEKMRERLAKAVEEDEASEDAVERIEPRIDAYQEALEDAN